MTDLKEQISDAILDNAHDYSGRRVFGEHKAADAILAALGVK